MSLEIDLAGQVAIVTGASSGIGRGIARVLGRAGAAVVVADIRGSPKGGGQPTAERLRESGIEATFVECDVSDAESVNTLVHRAVEAYGGVDVLVNNAGISHDDTIETMDDTTWESVLEVNLSSVFKTSRASMPHLRDSEAPRIINIASQLAFVGRPRRPAYCASKGGVISLTRQLAVDYADVPVLVNAVCPGVVRTALTEDLLDDSEGRAFLEDRTPLPYFGRPEDIGGPVAFLASEHARYITGECVVVDGGYLAG